MATVTKEYDLIVNTGQSEKNVENLNKDLEKTEADLGGVQDAADKATGGMVSGFKGAVSGLKGVTKGFKTVGGAIKASGLGLLVITITALTAAFSRSEEGQNKFAKVMGVLSAVFDVFADRVANLGELIIDIFTKPGKVLEDFSNMIQRFVMDKVQKVTEGLGFLGGAISKLFSGDFKGALSDAGKGLDSLNKGLNPLKMATDAVVESTKNLVKELTEEGRIAGEIADMRAKADKAERQLLVDRAKANRDRADLLEKAVDKEKFSVEERIQFLKDAGALEDEITEKEIQAAQLRLDAKIAENALGKSTKEDLEEEATLRANLINLETAKLTKAKEVTSQIIALNAEEAAAQKALDDQAIADQAEEDAAELEAENQLAALKKQIRDAEAVTEDERRALEIQKTIEHYDELIRLAKAQGLATEQLEKAKTNALNKFNQTNAENSVKWEDMTGKEKLGIASDTLGNMATILGEESAAGKAAAIGQATISTFQSATDSYKSMAGIPIIGPALGAIAAAAAVVSGMAQVKAITATKLPTLAGKTPPAAGGSPPPSPAAPTPPSFNIVGASATNQLADVIGEQTQQPVQAFVVASDVTTAQGLERNTIEGATIG
jgi:hypothetical protein